MSISNTVACLAIHRIGLKTAIVLTDGVLTLLENDARIRCFITRKTKYFCKLSKV